MRRVDNLGSFALVAFGLAPKSEWIPGLPKDMTFGDPGFPFLQGNV